MQIREMFLADNSFLEIFGLTQPFEITHRLELKNSQPID